MADQDELRLRIVPELDDEAVKRIKAQLDALYGQYPGMPPGSAPTKPGGDPDAPARKQRLADIRAEMDLRDLLMRKENIYRQNNIQRIQQEMALGKMAMEEGARLIAEQENLRERAANNAEADILKQIELAETLNLTRAQYVAIERKGFHIIDRAQGSFGTMARSMTQVTSNTKSANIAVANFARIIQDLPFGILGISNNIDPMLNSFADVKTTAGGATGALKQMLAVLRGPLGLIFLIGSVLPTALVVAERAMQRKKKATVDVKNSTDDYIGALKSAASSQISELIPSTLSYAKQVELLESAIRGLSATTIRQNDTNETLVSNVRGPLLDSVQSLSLEYGKLNTAQSDATGLMVRDIDVVQAALVAKQNQNQAVKEIIESKLNEVRATQAIRDALKNLNIERQKSTEEIREEQRAQEDYDFYMARRGATRVLEADTALRRVSQLRNEAIDEEERLQKAEEDRFNRFVTTSGIRNDLESKNIIARLQLYETSEEMVGEVMSAGARFRAQLLENEQEGLIGMMDLSTSIARNAFGDIKEVAIAEALVNTYVGVTRALRRYDPPLSGIIAGLKVAEGLAQVNRIRNTKIGDSGISSAPSSSAPTPSGPRFVTDVGAAGQIAGTIGPFGAFTTPNINVTATIDRQGLALAVRDGEADIATRQIPFAS